jgi:hypothetical protein
MAVFGETSSKPVPAQDLVQESKTKSGGIMDPFDSEEESEDEPELFLPSSKTEIPKSDKAPVTTKLYYWFNNKC